MTIYQTEIYRIMIMINPIYAINNKDDYMRYYLPHKSSDR